MRIYSNLIQFVPEGLTPSLSSKSFAAANESYVRNQLNNKFSPALSGTAILLRQPKNSPGSLTF